MKKKAKQKDECGFNLYSLFCVAATLFLVLNFGGFFESSFVFVGIFAAMLILGKKLDVKISLTQIIFFAFAIWYFICSVKDGFVIEYTARGIMPLVVLLFWIIASNLGESKEKVIAIITEVSLWIAVIALIHCIVVSINRGELQRLTFPFDYSNACGIFFSICYFYARHSETKFLNRSKGVFLAGLVLSQSVGAVCVFAMALMYCLIAERKYKTFLIAIGAVFGFCLVFAGRILESGGTFIERLLQIHDGALCIADNPVFGIGAGQWEHAKNYYQTGFYAANTLHSSFMAVGVASGIPGLVLFLTVCFMEIKKILKCKKSILPVIMLLVHALMDFSLSFAALSLILVLSLENSTSEKGIIINPWFKKAISAMLTGCLVFLLMGLLCTNMFQKRFDKGYEGSELAQKFESSLLLKSSIKANQCLGAALYIEKNDDIPVSFENFKFMPVEMILYESLSKEGEKNFLADCLRKQPYNTALRDYALADGQWETTEIIGKITDSAVEESSFWGKILYDLKGENL